MAKSLIGICLLGVIGHSSLAEGMTAVARIVTLGYIPNSSNRNLTPSAYLFSALTKRDVQHGHCIQGNEVRSNNCLFLQIEHHVMSGGPINSSVFYSLL